MIIIRNQEVTFFLDQVRANQIPEYVGPNAYYTVHGWFYPITFYANDILDVLDGHCKKANTQHDIQKAILITPDGRLYEYTIDKKGDVRRRRCLYTEDFIYHRCDEPKEDQMLSTFIEVAPLMTNEEMIIKVIENSELIRRKLMTMTFQEILSELHKRFPTDVEKK